MKYVKFRVWFPPKYGDKGIMRDVKSIDFISGRVVGMGGHGKNINEDGIEVLQYTGMKDDSGIELYDGDIIRHIDNQINSETIGPIYRKSGTFVFDVVVDEFVYTVPLFTLRQMKTSGYNDTIEYIGNIYES